MGLQTSISVIWLIFAVFFGLLAYHHWRLSKEIIPRFTLPKIRYTLPPPGGIPVSIGVTARDVIVGFDGFRDGLNSYIEARNESSRRQNRLQALGYMVASFMAVFSLFATI